MKNSDKQRALLALYNIIWKKNKSLYDFLNEIRRKRMTRNEFGSNKYVFCFLNKLKFCFKQFKLC